MPSEQELTLETLNIIGPEHYAKNGYPHKEWAYLRKHKPVFWCEHPKTDPFWAITKHADIIQIAKQPQLFLNGPRLLVFVNESGTDESPTPPFRHLLDMDPPDHGEYRAILSRHFTPRGVRPLQPEIENITRKVLDDVTARGDRGAARGAASGLGSDVPMDQRNDRQRRSGIPAGNHPAGNDGPGAARLVPVLHRHGGIADEASDQRHHEHRRQREDQGRIDSAVRDAVVLLPAGGGRQRDHAQRDYRWLAGFHRESRRMAKAEAQSVADRFRGRGDRPLDYSGYSVRADGERGHRDSRAEDSRR